MDLRIKGLDSIDPLSVPLPNGTEVTTRVDRVLGERRVPQGAVGRVVAANEDQLDVNVVGVGVVRYARSELVPRKVGQVRYAQRRASAWDSLRGCAVLESVVGSRAWGLAHEGSDTDIRGVFALPFAWTQGLVEPPVDLLSTDGSTTYWEARKAATQALRADPNTLEMLFVSSVRPLDPIGEWLIAERDAFVSAEIYGSFGRYALSQLKRVAQSMRLAEHRAVVLEWLREEPTPSLDEVALRLAKISTKIYPSEADAILQAKEYIKQLYRSMFDQGLLPSRDLDALVKFARTDAQALELPRDVRPKNAYNLVRLIGTAIGWLKTGAPELTTSGTFRDQLLAIKTGQMSLDEVVALTESMTPELDAARQSTKLPKQPDIARVDRLLHKIGDEIARRWVLRAEGPWGASAPTPPEAEWED